MSQVLDRAARFPRLPAGILGARPPATGKCAPGNGEDQPGTACAPGLHELAAGVAHNLNNALTVIGGNAGLIRRALPPGSLVLDMLQRIEATVLRTEEMTRQLLLYSQASKPTAEILSLGALVEDLKDCFHARVSSKVTVDYDLSPALPDIMGDWTQLRRLVTSLFLNACEAIGENTGAIVVRAQTLRADRAFLASIGGNHCLAEGRYVWLQIVDTGCGMDEETRQHVFEPFFSTKFIGRGLGLSAGLGIVRQHRGAMWVSSAPGKGTTVQVLLPCSK